jgi:glycosyltransferase involved in cell wall biosynthesis
MSLLLAILRRALLPRPRPHGERESRRIVFLITMSLERPGGVRYFNIARELVRSGYRVRIIALHPAFDQCRQRRFVRDGVEVWYVGQMHARKSGSVPGRFGPLTLLRVVVGSTLGMVWGVICSPADAYHLGKPQPINGMASLLSVLILRRRPLFVDWDDDEVRSNRLTAAWQRAVFGFWQWLLPRLATGVTVNSQALAERVAAIGDVPYVCVPNGVDPDLFTLAAHDWQHDVRRKLGLEGRRVVAYAGTLALQNHPVDLLLDAFTHIAHDLPDVDLLLIGGGEDMPELQRMVESRQLDDRVQFVGQVPQAEVPLYLSLAELSVDPVHDDAVARARAPLKIAESLALGVPVVTGDVGDRAGMLSSGAGWLVPPGDSSALARALRERLDDHESLTHARAVAYRVSQQYTWRVQRDRWHQLYQRLGV